MLDIIIQIILAILLLLIMGFLAYSIFDREYINNMKITNTNKKHTKIIDGVYSFTKNATRAETFNKLDPAYRDLNPSVNQNGGAEYSYNFWLYYNIVNLSANKIISSQPEDKYIILFFKGDLNTLPYKQYEYSCDTQNNKSYLLIKNPLVKLSNNGKDLIVEYNNINHPDTFNSASKKISCGSGNYQVNRQNKLGIKDIDNRMYNKTWNMITIVMQENPKQEDELFLNRTNCKVYMNGTLIANRSTLNNNLKDEMNSENKSTVMKKNVGNLIINPNRYLHNNYALSSDDYITAQIDEITDTDNITKEAPIKIADLTYCNYALSDDEILKLYKNKFNTNEAVLSDNTNNRTLKIGDRINLDTYDGEAVSALPVKAI
jgi:hypothetical protein